MSVYDDNQLRFARMMFEQLQTHPVGTEMSINDLIYETAVPTFIVNIDYWGISCALRKVISDDGRFRIDYSKHEGLHEGLPENIPFTFVRKGQSLNGKETIIAKAFAKENDVYGIRFVCYYYHNCIFEPKYNLKCNVDLLFPPPYIIIEGDKARWANKGEAREIYEFKSYLMKY